jgi:pyruvate dehydrogenase (quinone)
VAILAGRGALGASDELVQLAERVAGPIVKPLLGKAVVADQSPYTTGGIGLLGTAPSQEALEECDTLVMLGTSYPYIEFLPKPGQARCVQVDIQPRRIGLRHPVDVGLVGDCASVLRALLPMIQPKQDRSFLEQAQERMRSWNELMAQRGTRTDLPMKPQVPMYQLNRLLDDDAIICCDCGTVTTWVARYIEMRGTMQFAVSGMLATMAEGLPFAVAAATAYPNRQVVAIVGDGGFTMLMGEIATMVKYNLPVKVFIIKNNTLGQIKWEQMVMEGNPQFGVKLQPIDFAAYAKACGASGFCLDDPAKAEAVIREALTQPGPAVVECVIDQNEPPLPGKIKTNQAVEFAKSMVRGEKERVPIATDVVKDMLKDMMPSMLREVI